MSKMLIALEERPYSSGQPSRNVMPIKILTVASSGNSHFSSFPWLICSTHSTNDPHASKSAHANEGLDITDQILSGLNDAYDVEQNAGKKPVKSDTASTK